MGKLLNLVIAASLLSGCQAPDGAQSPATLAQDPTGPDTPATCDSTGSPFGGGDGSAGNPYLICNEAQLGHLASYTASNFKLRADIWLYNPFTPVTQFDGVFDGAGHTISNFQYVYAGTTASLTDVIAFFRTLNGTVKNLKLVGVNVNGAHLSTAASLAGINYGTITDCYAAGVVTGYSTVGGLVGINAGMISKSYTTTAMHVTAGYTVAGGISGYNGTDSTAGQIEQSYSSATVAGAGKIAGLIGFNRNGRISNCYTSSAVYLNQDGTSGVCGFSGGGNAGATIENSYSMSAVYWGSYTGGRCAFANSGAVSGSYFDNQKSREPYDETAVVGKTTAQMQTAATYSGWSASIWTITAGQYPKLAWE